MKKLLTTTLLLVSTIANAQVFSTPNKGGGEIVITARPCIVNNKTYENFREAYAWSPITSKAAACWTIRDGTIVLIYLKDGDERVYPMESFQEKK